MDSLYQETSGNYYPGDNKLGQGHLIAKNRTSVFAQ
jgi:hypothetical protein